MATDPESYRSRIQVQARVCALDCHSTHCTILYIITSSATFICAGHCDTFSTLCHKILTITLKVAGIFTSRWEFWGSQKSAQLPKFTQLTSATWGKAKEKLCSFTPPISICSWGMSGWEIACIRFSTSLKVFSSCNSGCDYSQIPLSSSSGSQCNHNVHCKTMPAFSIN